MIVPSLLSWLAQRDFGILRPRSAMMFFWMCDVPPPITSPSENIHSYGQ